MEMSPGTETVNNSHLFYKKAFSIEQYWGHQQLDELNSISMIMWKKDAEERT